MTETEANQNSNKPFPFLTPVRRRGFRKAVSETNTLYTLALNEDVELRRFLRNDRRCRMDFLRIWLRTNLRSRFQGNEGITFRNDNGGFIMEFDEEYVVDFKKCNSNHPAWIPKAFERAISKYREPVIMEQLALHPDFAENRKILIPLNELTHIIAVFDVEKLDGTIKELHFRDQQGGEIKHQTTIDLFTEVLPLDPGMEEEGQLRISIKA